MLEIKDGKKSPSRRKLTDWEERWHRGWRGQAVIVKDIQEALLAIGIKHYSLLE